MDMWVLFQIGAGELEQRGGGPQVVSLQMYERAGQLNQAFVKSTVRAVFVVEPQMFQYLMGLVEKLFVKAMKITEVVRVEFSVIEFLNHRGDAFALAAHGFKIKSQLQSLKLKLAFLLRTSDIGLVTLGPV